ncbi:MAG: PAS domain-containing protein [Candidatus Thorarchaeota archaeon]
MTVSYEFLSKFADQMNVGIVLVDSKNTIILFNKLAGEMLRQNPEERIGSSILRCHGEVSEGPVLKMINEMRNGVLEKYEGWVNFRGRILFEYIYPIWDDDGNYIGVVEELHDAAEKAEFLKTKGDWKDIHVSGLGEKSPRTPNV